MSGRGIDPLLADSIVDANLRSVASGHLPPEFAAGVAPHHSGKGAAAAQLDYGERLLKSNPGPALANAVRHANIMTWASRGAWDSAMVAAETLVGISTDTLAALHAFRAAAVGAWLGAVDESTTLKLRDAAVRSAARLGPWAGAEIAWLDGVLAFAREDADGVAASRRAVNAATTPSAGILDSSLAALALGLAGDRRAAGEQLAALELGRADIHPYRFGNEHPYFPSVTRLTAASWLASENDAAGARRLLEWHEAIINQPAQSSTLWSVSSAAYLQRGRVEEQLGNRDRARKFYQKFLDRYDLPDPNQQHLVDEAETALARLSGLRETR